MNYRHKITKEIIRSLKQNPENWTFDAYYARHKQQPFLRHKMAVRFNPFNTL